MGRPHVYIHRAGEWYPLYMNEENEARLREFATVTSRDGWAEPLSPAELVADLRGVDGILSLNGLGATEITTEVLERVGSVRVAVIAHWWHGGHVPARELWRAAGGEGVGAPGATTPGGGGGGGGGAVVGVGPLAGVGPPPQGGGRGGGGGPGGGGLGRGGTR